MSWDSVNLGPVEKVDPPSLGYTRSLVSVIFPGACVDFLDRDCIVVQRGIAMRDEFQQASVNSCGVGYQIIRLFSAQAELVYVANSIHFPVVDHII